MNELKELFIDPTKWISIGFAVHHNSGNEYTLLMQNLGNRPVYNIIKKGDNMPAGGYYNLEALMRLKGLNGFQSGGAR